MSMVAIFRLDCCGVEMAFGRFINNHAMHEHETTCPSCGKKVVLSNSNARYAEEHLENIPDVHKYILPRKPKEPELLF